MPSRRAENERSKTQIVLLPGTTGDEDDWTSGGGFADIMLDNLIAAGRMTPMVVVMHASDVLDPPEAHRGNENLLTSNLPWRS
jgi:hypothetical protein